MARYWCIPHFLAVGCLTLALQGFAWSAGVESEDADDYGVAAAETSTSDEPAEVPAADNETPVSESTADDPTADETSASESDAKEPAANDSDAEEGSTEAPADPAETEPQPIDAETGTAEATDNSELKPEPQVSAAPATRTSEVIRERYPDGNVKIKREVTQDDEGNYVNHGPWSMWDARGQLIAEGQFANGKRDGLWSRWHQRDDSPLLGSFPYNQFTPPFISQATFKKGQLDGKWTIYDSKQRRVSEWEFVAGERHGKSTWYYANGRKLREVTYNQDAIDGEALEWNTAAELVTRENYISGRKLAPKTTYHGGNQKKTEGMYLHAKIVVKTPDDWWACRPAMFTTIGKDEKHGVWNAWYPAGQPQMRGEFKNDVEVGQFIWWFPNGQKALEGIYDNGRQHGQWVWWHKNGQKSTQGEYAQGEQTGKWLVWHEDGRVGQAAEHFPAGQNSKASTGAPATSEPQRSAARSGVGR